MSLSFEYFSCLGHGSFGIVLKARSTDNYSFFAVKIIFPEKDQDIKNLKRECEMKGKSHQNVVEVFNFFETVFTNVSEFEKIEKILGDDGDDQKTRDQLEAYKGRIRRKKDIPAVILKMELCGPTLRDWLKQHVNVNKEDSTFQSTQLEIVKDMINGMQFLHENKIIHRDFKPDNVMFSLSHACNKFAFPLKIGDFGLCRILHSDESKSKTLTSRLGSLDYMAPEMDGSFYNLQSDIYSLGLVIWEVVQIIPFHVRKKLFNGLVTFDKIELIYNRLPSFTSMIINMTKKDLKNRTKSIKEVKDIFNELIVDFKKVKLNVSKDKAEPNTHEEALSICKQLVKEKKVGFEDPHTLGTEPNIAACLFNQGKFVEAKKEFEEVLKLKVKVLGEDHADTLSTKYWLSDTLYSLGQKEEALEMMEQVLTSQYNVLGPSHPCLGLAMNKISYWRNLN